MTNKINVTDLQFTGKDENSQKLRRLVQDLVAAERAVNALILAVSDLNNAEPTPVTISGIKFSGLTAGQVLTALNATSAAFETLSLESLSDVVNVGATDGQVLTYFHGQWVNSNLPTPTQPPAGINIGTGVDIYAGIEGGNLAFKSIAGDGLTIQVGFTADTLTLSYIGPTVSGPQGLQGPPGIDGADGEEGPQGIPGMAGAAGLQGLPGPPGPPGADGADGEDGQMGVPGQPGAAGLQGQVGPQGPPGQDGADGDDGPMGPPGPIGPQGPPGTGGTGSGLTYPQVSAIASMRM